MSLTSNILNPTNIQFNMTSQGLEISADGVQVNPNDEVQTDKDFYEIIKKINPTNYQDSSKVYLIKDVINNITSILPMFWSRSLIMQQDTLDEKSDWNNLQPNSMQVFLSTSGLNAPYLASTNSTGIVFTFNLKTDELNKMYQLAFSVGDNISFAIRGKDIDLDGAEWHYTPNVVDYDTFKGAVNDKLDDMYSKFVTGMDAYKPENLEPIIEKADKMVQDATNNAQISVDGFKADITQKVNDTLAQLKTVQDSANKLQSQVTDFSNQKIQEINNNYDSQLKDLEKIYVADVQSYITQVNQAQASLDNINKTLASLNVSKLLDLSDYYTKEDVNKVIANTLSGYITSTAVDTKISNAISSLYTKDEIDSKVKAIQDLYNNIGIRNLLPDTKNLPSIDHQDLISKDTYNGNAVVANHYTDTFPNAATYIDPISMSPITKVNNEYYTLSFIAWADNEDDEIGCYFFGSNSMTTSTLTSQGYTIQSGDGRAIFKLTTKPTRYWVKWRNDTDNVSKSVIVGRVLKFEDGYVNKGTTYTTSPMLVEGTIPVSWMPAPEDYVSKSDSLNTHAVINVISQADYDALTDKTGLYVIQG